MSASAGRPPPLSEAEVSGLVCKYFQFCNVVQDSIKPLQSYDDRNYYFRGQLSSVESSEFILKVSNHVHASFEIVREVTAVMNHINSCDFSFLAPCALKSTNGNECILLTHDELTLKEAETVNSTPMKTEEAYSVRVLKYIPGEMFDEVDKRFLTPDLICEIGKMIGSIDKELKANFSAQFLKSRYNIFDLANFLDVQKYLMDVDDCEKRNLAETVLKSFKENVVPKMPLLTHTTIHGDVNGQNIIVRRRAEDDSTYSLAAIIDFDDSSQSYTIFDLGIGLAYIMLENPNPVRCSSVVEFVGPLIAGYNSILPISSEEFDCLYYLVLARCIQSAVLGLHSYKAEPWNDYLLLSPSKAFALVNLLLGFTKEEVDRLWKTFL